MLPERIIKIVMGMNRRVAIRRVPILFRDILVSVKWKRVLATQMMANFFPQMNLDE